MKRFCLLLVIVFTALSSMVVLPHASAKAAGAQEGSGRKHGLRLEQYEEFHNVLHPLQHNALLSKDFKEIRAKSALLHRRGRAIVKLGISPGTSKENRAEFAIELTRFRKALDKYRQDARRGTDFQLEASYSAVHDSFEMLAAMLPGT